MFSPADSIILIVTVMLPFFGIGLFVVIRAILYYFNFWR